jgi:hypothetical protein
MTKEATDLGQSPEDLIPPEWTSSGGKVKGQRTTTPTTFTNVSDLERWPDIRPEVYLAASFLESLGIPAKSALEYMDARAERKARRVAAVLNEGAALSGLTVPELFEASEKSDEASDLLEDVMRAASRARSTEHVRALARVLKVAICGGDPARVDDLRTVVDVLDRLDPVAVRALQALNAVPSFTFGPGRIESPEPRTVLAKALGSDVVTTPVINTLEQLGLMNTGVELRNDGITPSDERTIVTPFGRRVLDFLAAHATDD